MNYITNENIHNNKGVFGLEVQEKREKVNEIVRLIAYYVFSNNQSERYINQKFKASYDALYGRILLDHDISISKRMKASTKANATLFDVIDDEEMDLVLISALNLLNMYQAVIDKKQERAKNPKKPVFYN